MNSMTGYAALDRDGRRWDLRSVNARGLDLRLRLPDIPGLEQAARAALQTVAARGGVTLTLRLNGGGSDAGPRLDEAGLARALDAVAKVEAAYGGPLAPMTAADLLGLRGVWEMGEADPPPLDDLKFDLADLCAAFAADRAREGAALREVLAAQVDEIADLVARARGLGDARQAQMADAFRAALARVAEAGLDERRVATEIAALAVKADIAEELDRLDAHVAAARVLLTDDKPAGRRLDFLTQEFNREANTLCAKAQMTEMTEIGLALKAVIDRLREQVQNVE